VSTTATYIKDMSMGVSPPVVVGSWSSLHERHVKEKLKSRPVRIQHIGRTAQNLAAALEAEGQRLEAEDAEWKALVEKLAGK
jgi:hypothetical protein